MNQTLQRTLTVLAAAVLLGSFCVFTVTENELAIRTQFREIVGTGYGPRRPLQMADRHGAQVRAPHRLAELRR